MDYSAFKPHLEIAGDGCQAQLTLNQQTWQLSLRDDATTELGTTRRIDAWEGPEISSNQGFLLFDRLFSGLKCGALEMNTALADALTLPRRYWRRNSQGLLQLDRQALYQIREAWLSAEVLPVEPEVWTRTGTVEHPRRPQIGDEVFYRRYVPAIDRVVELRQATVATDGERFHRWQNEPRVARFWEYPWDRARLDAMLEDRRADGHSLPLILQADGDAVGYFEAYYVAEDRLGQYCEANPFDQGFHLLVGEERYLGEGQGPIWLDTLSHALFLLEPRTRALFGEPRADNHSLLRLLKHTSWNKRYEFDFPHKRAALVVNERPAFFTETIL